MVLAGLPVVEDAQDCSCSTCVNACRHKPGWFLPGEAEKVAEYLGMTLHEAFESKLAVDYWEDSPNVFVLSPAATCNDPGEEFPYDPRGRCVFLTDDERCSIHAVKPFECRAYRHDDENVPSRHEATANAWRDHQEQIGNLLGREPIAAESDDDGFFGGLLGW